MANQTTQEPQQAEVVNAPGEKKGKGPLFWIALACGGCLLLLACACTITGILCATSEDFKEDFTQQWCSKVEEQGLSPDEDPLGICK